MVFRDMTQFAEKKVKSRTNRRAPNTAPGAGNVANSSARLMQLASNYQASRSYLAMNSRHSSSIQPHLTTNWKEVAVPRFFADYMYEFESVQIGTLQFLPEVLKTDSTRNYSLEALQAVALVSMANQLKLDSLLLDSRYAYGRAISGLAKALFSQEETKSDAVYATTYLLGFYEVTSLSSGTCILFKP